MKTKNYEIRIHGRAGQGAKSAADFLAAVAAKQGKFVQAFPQYGPERMGAPVEAYVRISDEPIRVHCNIYTPKCVIVINETLLGAVNVLEGLDDDGILIINTKKSSEDLSVEFGFAGGICSIDASKIALGILGKDIPNTVLLGAFAKLVGLVEIEGLKKVIREKFFKKLGEEMTEANVRAVEEGYRFVNDK